MSEFSEKIRIVIKNSKLTMPYLAEMSGLSVPNLYKICQGKRLPKEKDKILALIRALQCPKSEELALIKDYQIELLGRDVFFCLEAVQQLLPQIGRKNGAGMYYIGETVSPDVDVLCGRVDCCRYLQYSLMEEVKKNKEGHIKIIGGEESSFLLESIPVILQNSQVVCEHIFRLDSKSLPDSDRKNVQLISAVLPYLFGGFHYRPYYFYEYGRVKDNKIQLFHSALILPEQVILLTDDYDNAVILKSPEQIQMMEDMFSRLQEESIPMIRCIKGMDNWQKLFDKMYAEGNKQIPHILLNNIFALSVLKEEELQKHIIKYTPEGEQILRKFYHGISQFEKEPSVHFSSKSALINFVKTGKLELIPEDLYIPLTLEERIRVLEQLRMDWENYPGFYFLNESRFSISDSLFVVTYSETDSIIGYYKNQTAYAVYLLNEKGISTWVHQFLRYLEKSELVLSREETLACVDEELEELRIQLKNENDI